jgi:hypothetical protein
MFATADGTDCIAGQFVAPESIAAIAAATGLSHRRAKAVRRELFEALGVNSAGGEAFDRP